MSDYLGPLPRSVVNALHTWHAFVALNLDGPEPEDEGDDDGDDTPTTASVVQRP